MTAPLPESSSVLAGITSEYRTKFQADVVGNVSLELLSVIAFLLMAALNFSTGSAWGVPAIVSPILLPL